MKLKKVVPLFLLISTLFLMVPMTVPASGADGSTGAVDLDMTVINDKTFLLVHFTTLTGGADYLVNWTGDNTGVSFTVASGQTDYYVPITFNYPSSGSTVTVYLRAQSAGTSLASHTVTVVQASTIINDAQFLEIIVPVIIVVVLIGIVVDIGSPRRS